MAALPTQTSLWLGFVATALCTPLFRNAADAARPPPVDAAIDIPAFPPEVVRPFTFGFSSLVADLTFLESIQLNAVRRATASTSDEAFHDRGLARLLDYTVDVDPAFDGAYRFAGSALPRHTTDGHATGVLAAERILQKGTREIPDDWRIPFELGFIQSFYLGHMTDAAQSMARSAALPGAPKYVGFLATRLAADAGSIDLGERLAAAMEVEATEDATREAWHARMLDLRMERHLREIESAARAYEAKRGRKAPSVRALVADGDLAGIPEEPHGGLYRLTPDGEAVSTAAPRLRVRGRSGTTSGLLAQ